MFSNYYTKWKELKMKEVKRKIDHEGEPLVDYGEQGYAMLTFPYYDFEVQLKCVDPFSDASEPEVHLKVFRDERDVTPEYFDLTVGPGYIRPTMWNIKQVLEILDENMYAEDDAEYDEENTVDTKG
jgi:hypothetical protein